MRTLNKVSVTALMGALCISLVLPAQAQIYKWVDEHGVTHYDSKPPPGGAPGKAQTLNIPATSATSASGATSGTSSGTWQEKDSAFQERYDKRKAQEAKDDDDAKTALAKRQRKCMYAREELNGVLDAGAVYRLDDQGNRIYLSEQQRTQHVADLRQQVSANCNG